VKVHSKGQSKRLTSQKRLHRQKIAQEKAIIRREKAFEIISESYYEVKSVSYTATCAPFYDRLETQTSPTARRVGRITFSPSDFVADVELAVKSAVNYEEYQNFIQETTTPENKKVLGAVFIERGIYPLRKYLESKDVVISEKDMNYAH
jgi:hypothetical protein